MRIAVTGSIASDHLMVFPGRFAEQLIEGQLERVSLSFLADDLVVRRGGVAANIAFALARLGVARPLLVGAAGVDFGEYGQALAAAGVDVSAVRISASLHTARFVCTTDRDQNQIATFYAGAMAEASRIDLAQVAAGAGGVDVVLVGADDPAAMLAHTAAARRIGAALAADPSQQLARLDREQARTLVDGARWLFTNAYEAALLSERTGWDRAQILRRVGTWITTLGGDGVRLASQGADEVHLAAVPCAAVADPTGAGDALRAGFLAGIAAGLHQRHAAMLGCAMATTVLQSVGTQEYKLAPGDLSDALAAAYGRPAATTITGALDDTLSTAGGTAAGGAAAGGAAVGGAVAGGAVVGGAP